MTHEEAGRYGLRWLLTRGWCSCAATEISYASGRLDAVGVAVEHDHETMQYRREWRAHLEAVTHLGGRMKRASSPPKVKVPAQIGVVEVKVTRADLLADLRQQKMHGYSAWTSHAWLLVTKEALLLGPEARVEECRAAAAKLDLPEKWGLLVVPRVGKDVISVNSAHKIRDVTPEECAAWRARIGRSLSWRALGD